MFFFKESIASLLHSSLCSVLYCFYKFFRLELKNATKPKNKKSLEISFTEFFKIKITNYI